MTSADMLRADDDVQPVLRVSAAQYRALLQRLGELAYRLNAPSSGTHHLTVLPVPRLLAPMRPVAFDCGRPGLNWRFAGKVAHGPSSDFDRTFLLRSEDEVSGYYHLAVEYVDLMPERPQVQPEQYVGSILILVLGRLAVALHEQGKALGAAQRGCCWAVCSTVSSRFTASSVSCRGWASNINS